MGKNKLISFITITCYMMCLPAKVFAEGGRGYQEEGIQGIGLTDAVLFFIVVAAATYLFWIRPSKNKAARAIGSGIVQDLLYYKEIASDGLVILPDGRYRRMVEVFPTNLMLKTPEEQANCWLEFRNTVDTLSVDWTMIVQSRIMRMGDYLDERMQEAEELKARYPLLYMYQKQVIEEMRNEYEEKEKRERRYFIILKMDTGDMLQNENGFAVENAAVRALFSGVGFNRKKPHEDDLKGIATGELENAVSLLAVGLYRSGVSVRLLDKKGILDYLNNTLCHDIAAVQNIDLMDRTGVLNTVPASLTVDMFLTREALKMVDERELKSTEMDVDDVASEDKIHMEGKGPFYEGNQV